VEGGVYIKRNAKVFMILLLILGILLISGCDKGVIRMKNSEGEEKKMPASDEPKEQGGEAIGIDSSAIKLSGRRYEIGFSAENGSILYIYDREEGGLLYQGSRDDSLWWAEMKDGSRAYASSFAFRHRRSQDEKVLTMEYDGPFQVTVTARLLNDHSFGMQASVRNSSGKIIKTFGFPGDLKVKAGDVYDGLLPLIPGARLKKEFFTDQKTYVDRYPGKMFADYISVRTATGNMALYSKRGQVFQMTDLGFDSRGSKDGRVELVHNFKTWIEGEKTWISPEVVLSLGLDYPDTILLYRTDNGIEGYKDLKQKLGDDLQRYLEAPMYKLDLNGVGKGFQELKAEVLDSIRIPGIIHLVAFQYKGHDRSYPDFVPPDPRWGDTEDFKAFVKAAREKGHLVLPYTNFSWWDTDGPTMGKLPPGLKKEDIVAWREDGQLQLEKYGPNRGYVVNLHHPFVKEKIREQHELLKKTVGVDGILEDQWGARNAPYDFNPAGLEGYSPAESYFEGVLEHVRAHGDDRLMTECGVDVLAEELIGFAGTNYLWDILGYTPVTAPYTEYYPMAAMMLRDKVLLYQHDLAGETFTDNKEMLRWNLAYGYQLSGFAHQNPWIDLIGIFQKEVLSKYADELLKEFEHLDNNVIRTSFESFTVYSNWSDREAFHIDGYTVPPGGVAVFADDGSVRAGLFTEYNGLPLGKGEHYIVEVRSGDEIRIYQPIGRATKITVQIPEGWEGAKVASCRQDGTVIKEEEARIEGKTIEFHCFSSELLSSLAYYRIAPDRQVGQRAD